MPKKINIIQVASQIASITGCSQLTAEIFLKNLFSLLTENMQDGKKVKIKGIGIFKKNEDNQGSVLFEADKNLASAVNMPFSSFEAVELDDDVTDDVFNSEIISLSEIDETHTEAITHIQNEETKGSTTQKILQEDSPHIECPKEENEFEEGNKENMDNNIITNNLSDSENKSMDESSPKKETIVEQSSYVHHSINGEERYISSYKNKVGIYTYLFSILISLALGFGIGYIFKSMDNDSILAQRIDAQQKQLDSIHANLNNGIDTIKSNEPIAPKEMEKYDTVKVNRYITTMAQEYYGDTNFWSYIYEENKEILGHPELIQPGTIVKIPLASKYEINASDPTSIQKAKVKAIEIYAKFRK